MASLLLMVSAPQIEISSMDAKAGFFSQAAHNPLSGAA
jgi:hypothetical protein